MSDLTIVVNTSDGFEDCWAPFFKLFAKFWPGCPYEIVLNTECKSARFPGVAVRCTQVGLGVPRRLTWSQCLALCLDAIETPYVLYLQEDYFLEAPVQGDRIEDLLQEMRIDRADVIRLLECDNAGPWSATASPLLWQVDQHAVYRISMQAALWRKSTLRTSLRPHESPWQLEVFGSARARRQSDRVMCVNRELFDGPGRLIFPYRPTGVVSGRWAREIVVPLFQREGIEMDFSRRGFYDPAAVQPKRPIVRRLADRVRSLI